MNAFESVLEGGHGHREQHADDRHHHDEFKQSGARGARPAEAVRLGAAQGSEFQGLTAHG
jgi:hypothetical protein